ncbi:hypothetical protein PVAND_015387 [Polypedilum vanderplanki]|uniref:ABC transporter domain-containing protein n=1 Tax=Polypedilum vanderplanki TaxID=319348 RepID=A0A9J6BCW6_POLVA|nr:hypothetical protein PVAND_015387 [Polypedilum vanderplanki]
MSCVTMRNVLKIIKNKNDSENKNQIIFNGLNLTIKCGTIYILIGSSGCGKTTLLTCLLGMQKIQKGEIKIFNHKVEFEQISRFSKIIGYMPQQISLTSELTIYETLKYFANLHSMNHETFCDRLELISDLLELPQCNTMVKALSGGEQRRISLAVAIIHNSKLLILDEPTVGVDFLLREKIWNFLQKQTVENNLTVLTTTHYLNESIRANCCGFLRNGNLIAEGSATEIIELLEVSTLDKAFLKLCESERTFGKIENHAEENEKEKIETEEDKRWFRKRVIKGLMIKELHRMKRQPMNFLITFCYVSLLLIMIQLIMGRLPNDLKIGIFNNQNQNFDRYNSQRFLDFLTEFDVITYNSFSEAFQSFRKLEIFGLINILPNFTQNIINSENMTDNKLMELYIESSLFPLHDIAKIKILKALSNFLSNISEECDVKSHLLFSPMKVEILFAPLSLDSSISKTLSMVPFLPFCVTIIFSINLISQSRYEGIWNRSLLCGVRIYEIISIYIIECFCISILLLLEILITLKYLQVNIEEHFWIVCFVIFEVSQIGFFLGFFISILTDDALISGLFFGGILCSGVISSGGNWSLNTITDAILTIIFTPPVTIPGKYFNDLAYRGGDINKKVMIIAITSIFTWKIFIIIGIYFALKYKKFSNVDVK